MKFNASDASESILVTANNDLQTAKDSKVSYSLVTPPHLRQGFLFATSRCFNFPSAILLYACLREKMKIRPH